jgi:hypothetical protein
MLGSLEESEIIKCPLSDATFLRVVLKKEEKRHCVEFNAALVRHQLRTFIDERCFFFLSFLPWERQEKARSD